MMTVRTLPRRCNEILIVAGLQLVLTVTFVTGLDAVRCGTNSTCGYGARCEASTCQCACLSGMDNLITRVDHPFSLIYCLGEGVTQCGDKLCGYGTERTANCDQCECWCSDGELTKLKNTSPPLFYCVENCMQSNCPENTTCADPTDRKKSRCYCSEGATRSSTGQCLGKSTPTFGPSAVSVTTNRGSPTEAKSDKRPTLHTKCTTDSADSRVHVTSKSASPTQKKLSVASSTSAVPVFLERTDLTQITTPEIGVTPRENDPSNQGNDKEDASQILTIGLAVGISVGLLLALLVMVLLIWKHRRLNAEEDGILENMRSSTNTLCIQFNHSYENVVSFSLPGESRPGSRADSTVDTPSVDDTAKNSPNTYVNVSAPSRSPYNNDTSGPYESANTPDRSDIRLYATLRQNVCD